MATVFGVDLDDIETNQLIKEEHVKTIYGVLSGDPDYSDVEHTLQFNGSFLAGKDNSKDVNISVGFAFGKNNRVNAENSLVVGEDGESYAENQLVLSGGKLEEIGDSQSYFLAKSFSTEPGDVERKKIPSRADSISSFKIKVTGAGQSSNSSVAVEDHVLFFNSREDPVQADREGTVLTTNRSNSYESSNQLSSNNIKIEYEVSQNNYELELVLTDNRTTGEDINWAIDIKATEVQSGTGAYGYGYGYGGYNNTTMTTLTSSCFSPEMEVLTSDNKKVKLDNISQGDKLFSLDFENLDENYNNYSTKKNDIEEFDKVTSKVSNVLYSFADSYYLINDNIEVTSDQPIFVYNKLTRECRFVQVEDLKFHYKLFDTNEGFINVNSIKKIEESKEVITLDLEGSSVLFVEDILFHKV